MKGENNMGKKCHINCGNALLLAYRPEEWNQYEHIQINCGNALLSSAFQAGFAELPLSMNCGNRKVINVNGPIMKLQGSLPEGKSAAYVGAYLVVEGDLLLTLANCAALEGIAGLLVMGTLYHPSAFSVASLPNATLDAIVAYPEDAHVILDDLALTASSASTLPESALVWLPGNLELLDAEGVSAAKARKLRFQCDCLTILQEFMPAMDASVKRNETLIIPEGHALVDGDLALFSGTFAQYGGKLYVRGDCTLNPWDAECLSLFDSIVVEGKAKLPMACAEAFKRIGRAEAFLFYEGELWSINGKENISHAALAAASQEGIVYTLETCGYVAFESDVAREDLRCIQAIYYDGVLLVDDGLKPFVKRLVRQGSGMIESNRAMADAAGDSGDPNVVQINLGNYTVL